MFIGDMPCDEEGRPLMQIHNSSTPVELASGLVIDHTFSSRPSEGYKDHYDKMTTYAHIVSGPALTINPNLKVQTFAVVAPQGEDSVFKYIDTASSRAGIVAATEKLAIGAVAIVGLGGTGSYILDFIAKTPIKEIHLFDGDRFGQHNAFRSPSAPTLETLREAPQKAEYFSSVYSQMRNRIFFVNDYLEESTVDRLRDMDFVFLAIDRGSSRRLVVEKLCEFGVPFIYAGMGVSEVDGSLLGQLRVTTSSSDQSDHINSTVPFSDGNIEDEYARNIQIAELNALSAALAVIKWKKLMGFYVDLENEHSSYYQIDGNCLINENKV
jgi:hypothetical protein